VILLSVSCPLSAQWRLVASIYALRPGLSPEDVKRAKGIAKERRAKAEDKGKERQLPPTPFLQAL